MHLMMPPKLIFSRSADLFRSRFALAMDARLLALAALVGVLAAGVASLYFYGLTWVMAGAARLEAWSHVPLWAFMAAAGALVGLFYRLGEPGETDAVVNNIHVENGRVNLKANLPLVPISLVSIAAGGSAGPEAPMVHLTGSVGTWLHRRLKLPETFVRPLTFAGMSVGFATLFGAPVGSVIFALEIPHKRGMEYYEALMPALVGGLVGHAVFAVLTHHGIGITWAFPHYTLHSSHELLQAAGVGLVAGLAAMPYVWIIRGVKKLFRKLRRLPHEVRGALGGLALGLMATAVPATRFFGEAQLEGVPSLALKGLLLLAAAKMLTVALTLASGWRGGIIIPCFLIGACLGRAMALVVPGLDPTLAMVCGMAAVNVAVMKVPIGTVLVLVTMTGVNAIAPIALAGLVAFLVTGGAHVIDTQRAREEGGEALPAHGDTQHAVG
jgi:H+/Cl- antiporter ClcA